MATNFPGFSRLDGDAYEYARGPKKSESAPELLYKMCKKIAQLTKVVYVLNTRNEDLEMQCKNASEAAEEKTTQLNRTITQLKTELEKKMDLNERVKGLEETLKHRDHELRKLLEEIATVRKRQEERERELSLAYRKELRQAVEAQQSAERRLADVLGGSRHHLDRQGTMEYHTILSLKETPEEYAVGGSKDEEDSRRKSGGGGGEEEVSEFRQLVEQLQRDLKEKTERWEAVAKEERSKLEAQLERAKAAKEDAELLLAQQMQAESRNLVSQEARFEEKLSELNAQLSAKDLETIRLRSEIEELKRELVAKSSGMDRLQAELASSNKEGEYVKQTLRRLEDDVTGFRQKNTELSDELESMKGEMEELLADKSRLEEEKNLLEKKLEEDETSDWKMKLEELEKRVNSLQEEIGVLSRERDRLSGEKKALEREREEEMRIVQEALDTAIDEKAAIQSRFERDFETLRTVNTDREQQLLDDFEWKLREVEATCKRKLEDREKVAEEKIKAALLEADTKVKKELSTAKAHEAELAQLRGLTHEQQRSLRMGARQIESLQVSEKILQEEVSKLREILDREKAHINDIQTLHDKKVSDMEKSWKNRMEALRNEVNFSWEERLKRDLARLRTELETVHMDEKKKMEDEASTKMRMEKRDLERRLMSTTQELKQLKTTLDNKEANWRRDLEKTQAIADHDIIDLRRKLDKLDMSYQDQIENMTAKHQKELEAANEEAEKRLSAAEQNWQMQMSSTRTTLELVKEQMERDAQKRIEDLQEEYQTKLDNQWKRLNEEKEIAVLSVERKFVQQLELLKEEMENSNKTSSTQETEHLQKIINLLEEDLNSKTKVIDDLQGNVDTLQGGMQVLNQEINNQTREMDKYINDAKQTLREKEEQLEQRRLKEIEDLKKEHARELLLWKSEVEAMRDTFLKKIASLSAVSKSREDEFDERLEDAHSIADLQQALDEKEKDIIALTEELRFYQMELENMQKLSNHSTKLEEPVFPPRRKKHIAALRDQREMQGNASSKSDSGASSRAITPQPTKPSSEPMNIAVIAAAPRPSNQNRSQSVDFAFVGHHHVPPRLGSAPYCYIDRQHLCILPFAPVISPNITLEPLSQEESDHKSEIQPVEHENLPDPAPPDPTPP